MIDDWIKHRPMIDDWIKHRPMIDGGEQVDYAMTVGGAPTCYTVSR
jgi:hypothetical protein